MELLRGLWVGLCEHESSRRSVSPESARNSVPEVQYAVSSFGTLDLTKLGIGHH